MSQTNIYDECKLKVTQFCNRLLHQQEDFINNNNLIDYCLISFEKAMQLLRKVYDCKTIKRTVYYSIC